MSAKPIARREVRSGTTDFVESAVQDAAQRVIGKGEVIRLSAEDQTRLLMPYSTPRAEFGAQTGQEALYEEC